MWQEVRDQLNLDKGRELGFKEGREKGLEEGREAGMAAGREQGLAEGREAGMAAGREQGLAEGREAGIKAGLSQGLSEGQAAGESRFAALATKLVAEGRTEDVARAAADASFREQLYRGYGIA